MISNKNVGPKTESEFIKSTKISFKSTDAPTLADLQSQGYTGTAIPRGLIYFDATGNTVYFRDNSDAWTALGGAAGGTFAFDAAYNNGRTITADDTAVTWNWSHSTANLFTVAQSATGSGAMLALSYSAAATGDAVQLDMTTAVGARALNVTLAGTRTANGILLTHTGAGSADVMECNISSTPSGNFIDLNVSGAATGSLIDVAQSAATTGHVIKIVDSAATTGAFISADKGDTGVPTGNGLTLDMGTDVAGHTVSLLASSGTRTGHDILISPPTGAHTGSCIKINDPSTRSGNLISLAPTGALTGNLIDITNTGATTGHYLAMDLGDTGTPTGDAINIDLGIGTAASAIKITETNGARSDHRVVITAGTGAHSGGFFDLNDPSTSSVPMFDIDFTGLVTSHCLDITYGTAAATGNALDINMGTNLAGDSININRAGVATGNCIDISHGGASTGDSVLITLTNTTACKAINVDATVAHTVAAINMDSAGVMADNVGAVTLAHATGNITAGGAVQRISSSAALTGGVVGSSTPVSLLELVASSASATAYTALTIDSAASARTEPLVFIQDDMTAGATGPVVRIDLTANTTGAASIFDINVANMAYAGDVINIDIGGASIVGSRVMYVDATAAHTSELFLIDSQGVLANNKAVFDIAHATGALIAGSSVMRLSSSAVNISGAVGSGTPTSLLELVASSTSATAFTALTIDMAAAVRTEPALYILDAQTTTGSGSSLRIDLTANTSGAAKAIEVVVSNVAYAGKAISVDIGGATTVAATALYVDATSAHTGKIISIDTNGVMAAGVGCIHVAHTTGDITATGNLLRLNSTAVSTGGFMQYINMTAATGCVGLHVDGGAAARTTNLVEIQDATTSTTGASLRINNALLNGNALVIGSGIMKSAGRIQFGKGADVASGTDIVLGGDGNYFDITGITTVTTISATGWQAGSMIVLTAEGTQTWKHATVGTGASLWLTGAGDVTMTVNDTMILVYDGTYWRQCGGLVVA